MKKKGKLNFLFDSIASKNKLLITILSNMSLMFKTNAVSKHYDPRHVGFLVRRPIVFFFLGDCLFNWIILTH